MKIEKEDLTPEQKWEQAGLENGFIFYHVFRKHPDACKQLLEILLHIEIDKIDMHEEETIMADNGAKGIRLDLYLKNDSHVFDIELQVANTGELAERARYYAGLMDIDTLKSGELYIDLKTSHVIFICMEDIFHQGLPVYTFENICNEDNSLKLNDRAYKHFFIANNCDKISNDKEQKAFLNLLLSNKATTDYTKDLTTYIREAKHDSQWRHTYMEYERQRAYDRRDGRLEGLAEGLIQGRKQGLAQGKKELQQKALETAKIALENNIPIEMIQKLTGLSIESINSISENL